MPARDPHTADPARWTAAMRAGWARFAAIQPPTPHELYKHELALLCTLHNDALGAKYEELLCGVVVLALRSGAVGIVGALDGPEQQQKSQQDPSSPASAAAAAIAHQTIAHWPAVFPVPDTAGAAAAAADRARQAAMRALVSADAAAAIRAFADIVREPAQQQPAQQPAHYANTQYT